MRTLPERKIISHHFRIDAKTLNKILYRKLSQYMRCVIHQTKPRLILGIQSGFKIQELIIVIHYIVKSQMVLTDPAPAPRSRCPQNISPARRDGCAG